MKKIFTLIAIALCAISAQAQGSYTYAEGDATGTDVTTIPNITLSYSAEGTWVAATANTPNWSDTYFVNCTAGNGANGRYKSGTAPTGCWYKFAPTIAGTLTVGIKLNAPKAFYIVKGSDNTPIDLATISYNLPSEQGGASQTFGTNVDSKGASIDNSVALPSQGTVTFSVAANETYYVLCTGSKLGFFGFKFTTGTSSIKNVQAESASENAALYNEVGMPVNKDYKGVVIQNGKKFVNK